MCFFLSRLSGSAAVKSRNVHLSLVDQHTQLRRRGVVQLFGQAHPRRLLASPYAGRSPPRLPAVGSRPAAGEQLSLPLDFNPTGLVQQLETVSQFQTPAAAAAAAEASADGHQVNTFPIPNFALRKSAKQPISRLQTSIKHFVFEWYCDCTAKENHSPIITLVTFNSAQ